MLFPDRLKDKKNLIAVIHLGALPGAPGYEGSMKQIIDRAKREAEAYQNGGVDAIIIENFGDKPFFPNEVPPETIAAMAAVSQAVSGELNIPFGINVLRNDANAALGIAAATGASFIRVNIHIAAYVADQGLIIGKAFETIRKRKAICPEVAVFCDVRVKHASPLAHLDLDVETRDLTSRGMADAVIVSGSGTGAPTSLKDVSIVKSASEVPVLIGSGITTENMYEFLAIADGLIVGSAFKEEGKATGPVEPARVEEVVRTFKKLARNY